MKSRQIYKHKDKAEADVNSRKGKNALVNHWGQREARHAEEYRESQEKCWPEIAFLAFLAP